jgi:hypothetical protein
MAFLAAGPHGLLDLGLALERLERVRDRVGRGEGAQPGLGRLVGRHAERHLVLLEGDDEELELEARDLLLLDRDDLADPVGGVDDEIVGVELALAGLGHGDPSETCSSGRGDRRNRKPDGNRFPSGGGSRGPIQGLWGIIYANA